MVLVLQDTFFHIFQKVTLLRSLKRPQSLNNSHMVCIPTLLQTSISFPLQNPPVELIIILRVSKIKQN